MLFKQAARGDERGFLTVKNVEATSITTGQGVALRIGTNASFDGTSAVRTASGTTADLPGFLGVATQDIPSNGFGLVQCFGNCSSVLLSQQNTSITINPGDPLIPSPLAGAFASGAPTFAASGFGYVIVSNAPTNTTSVAGPVYVSGFVRAIH
jgi:hypothetical protein